MNITKNFNGWRLFYQVDDFGVALKYFFKARVFAHILIDRGILSFKEKNIFGAKISFQNFARVLQHAVSASNGAASFFGNYI
jgi:hypothetical protein